MFQAKADVLKKVTEPDHSVGMHNTEHEKFFIYYWTLLNYAGKTFVTGTCCNEFSKTVHHLPTTTIPLLYYYYII